MRPSWPPPSTATTGRGSRGRVRRSGLGRAVRPSRPNDCRRRTRTQVSCRLRQRRRPTSSPHDPGRPSCRLRCFLGDRASQPHACCRRRAVAPRARLVRHRLRRRRDRAGQPRGRRPRADRARVRPPPRCGRCRRSLRRRRRGAPARCRATFFAGVGRETRAPRSTRIASASCPRSSTSTTTPRRTRRAGRGRGARAATRGSSSSAGATCRSTSRTSAPAALDDLPALLHGVLARPGRRRRRRRRAPGPAGAPARRGRVSRSRRAPLLRELVVLDRHVQGARDQRPPARSSTRTSPTATSSRRS